MKLTQETLKQMWLSGFCLQTCNFSANTEDSGSGSTKRVAHLQRHIKECSDCNFASRMKVKEMDVAEKIGPDALVASMMGGDVTKHHGFNPDMMDSAMEEVFAGLKADGLCDADFKAWFANTMERHNLS